MTKNQAMRFDIIDIKNFGYPTNDMFAFLDYRDKPIFDCTENVNYHYEVGCDGFITMCTKGSYSLVINGVRYEMKKGMICLMKKGDSSYMVEHSEDCRTFCMLTKTKMEFTNLANIKTLLSMRDAIENKRCFHFNEKAFDRLCTLLDLMKDTMYDKQITYQNEIIQGYLRIFFYYICMEIVDINKDDQNRNLNRGDDNFKRFMELVSQHYKQQRQVAFYAGEMCLTPKYLSTLVKTASGRSAREWIVDFVISECKRLLVENRLSIQEIGYELNFPNPSFFAHFFKTQTGLSPMEFKSQNIPQI